MENSKKFILFLIIVAVLLGGYYLFFASKDAQKEQQTEKQKEVSESDTLARKLAEQYQAVTDWEENLTYTLEVQERLITDKPTLFRGYVDDVFDRNGQTFVRFSSFFLSQTDYVLELECSRFVVDKILTQQKENKIYFKFFDEYAIVATIQEVSRPVFALKGSAFSEDEVEIDVESSGLFIAKGTCVDITYIGDDNLFND